VRQDLVAVVEPHPEHRVRERLDDLPLELDLVFLRQLDDLVRWWPGARRRLAPLLLDLRAAGEHAEAVARTVQAFFHAERVIYGPAPSRRSGLDLRSCPSSRAGCRRNRRHLLEAEREFRGIIGFSDLVRLAVTAERELTPPSPNPVTTEETAIVVPA
jgi:hypothetical protein